MDSLSSLLLEMSETENHAAVCTLDCTVHVFYSSCNGYNSCDMRRFDCLWNPSTKEYNKHSSELTTTCPNWTTGIETSNVSVPNTCLSWIPDGSLLCLGIVSSCWVVEWRGISWEIYVQIVGLYGMGGVGNISSWWMLTVIQLIYFMAMI